MGGNTSSSVVTDSMTEFSENLTNISTTQTQSSVQNIQTNQNFSLDITGNVVCTEGLTIDQTNQTTADLSTNFSSQNQQQFLNNVQQALNGLATSTNTNVSGFMNTSIDNSNSSSSTVLETITNIASTNITSIMQSSCLQSVSQVQNQVLTIAGNLTAENCDWGQNFQLNASSNCVATSLLNLCSSNTALANAVSSSTANNSVTSTGLFQDLFSGLSNLVGSIFSGVNTTEFLIIGGILIFIGLLIWGLVHIIRGNNKKKNTIINNNNSKPSLLPQPSSSSSPPPPYSSPSSSK